jgi:ankyrin repeat protein
VEVCIKDKPYQLLWEHIAKHLKSLAFLSLSYLDDDQDRNSTLYASEEASNQGDPSISRESVGVCNIDMFDDIPSTEVFLDHVTVTEQEFPDIPLLAEPEHWKFMPSQNALVDKDPLLAEPEHWKVIPSQNALVDKDDLESRSSNRGQTLDGVMSRIHNQPADLRGVALQALSWVSHVKQPLSPTELRYAVQFDGNFHDIDTIISSCMGLIFEKSNAIHMTYENKEILTNRPLFQGADDKILGVSLHCLMSTEFLTGPCRSNEAFAERLQLHPFYKYASQNWFRYCEEITPQVRYFLANDMLIEASVQALFAGMEDSQRYPRRLTRLHLTAIFGLDRLLIEDRGVIELKDSWGRTPASWAAENGNLAIIQHLIESGAKVDTKEETFGQTPLSIAAQNGHTAAVQWLIGKEADIESLNNSGQTPLSVAAQHGHDAVVRLLLSAGADIESKSDSGRTPLSYATENGNLSVVDLLLHDGADIESNSTSSQTPLAWAAENGNVEVARLLLDRGANIESRSGYGRTPLSWAAQTGHEAVVKLLLDRGAQIEAVSSYGQTALSLAVENGKVSVVKLLLERGADVNSRSGSGRTPLSWSTETGDAVVTKLLIDKGAELDAKDISGSTPLAWAVENGNLAAVRLLLEKGAYLDPVDDNERTPLSIAVENGHNAISLLLLEKGNFLHAVDNNSPIHTSTAITDASNILIRRIQEKGAKADMRDHDRLKALQAILRKYNDTAATLAKTSQAKRGDVSKSTDGEAEGKVTTQDAPAADKSLVSIFKSDTIIDGTVMAPDMDFEQTWVLRNDGDIPWPSGCMLIFISGNSMGRPELQETSSTGDLKPYNMSAATSNLVEPGQEASFTVYLRSPPREGRFISYWRLVTKSGVRFGHRLWCDIVVKKEEED